MARGAGNNVSAARDSGRFADTLRADRRRLQDQRGAGAYRPVAGEARARCYFEVRAAAASG
jgi:hypothetical protein